MSTLDVEAPRAHSTRGDRIHPLLAHELTQWAQHPAFSVLLVVWLVLVVGSALLIYLVGNASAQFDPEALGGIAGGTAGTMAGLCLALAIFVAPGLTGAALSGEQSRGVMRLLYLTPVGVARVVWFKQFAAWWMMVVLLAIPLPVIGLSVVQGVPEPPIALLAAANIVLSTSWFFCALGLFISARVLRRASAALLTYLVALSLSFGLPIVAAINFILLADQSWIRASFLVDAINLLAWIGFSLSAPTALVLTFGDLFEGNITFSMGLRGAWSWVLLSAAYWGAGVALVGLAVRQVRRAIERG